ncbi:hypothetical protein KEM48_012774 [Puccinia striiformis f. sp. tritici PST-130]|nr:hypothetical protein KEM48_012774 [Puccinia striiformis f. sp. tritici PST-130]
MANEMTLKEQLANIPKLIVTNDPGPNPAARVKKQLSEAANILVNKIDDKLCTSIVTDDNDNNGTSSGQGYSTFTLGGLVSDSTVLSQLYTKFAMRAA